MTYIRCLFGHSELVELRPVSVMLSLYDDFDMRRKKSLVFANTITLV